MSHTCIFYLEHTEEDLVIVANMHDLKAAMLLMKILKLCSFEDYSLLVKIEYTYIEPFEEDCIYFKCRKDSLEGIGSIINRAIPYLTSQPDTMLIVSEAPYFDIIKNDSMHYILDEDLHFAYDTSTVSYAKRIDSITFKLIYKEKCDGYSTLKLPMSRWGKAELF